MDSDNIAGIHKGKFSLFPSRLRLLRVQQGWTQSELADLIGTTQINVSRWENAASIPSPYFRRKLAELFGMSVEELLLAKSQEENAYKAEKKAGSPSIPSSILTIPYPRNPFFTGREEILARLHSMLQQQKSAALTQASALSGLGGIGKTQIALEYAYRYQEHYKTILWVDAYTRDNFLKLAAMLDLPEQHEQELEIVLSAVKRWLGTHTDWLLILDNVEDPTMIAEFLPRHNQGNVLITTRLHTLGTIADSIEVEKMGHEEAIQFLLRRSRSARNVSTEERALVETIVNALDALPLALDQAGAYMEENCCSFQDYLALYHSRRLELLQIRSMLPADHPQSVVATWSLSFEQVERIDPAAADLLRLISFLDSAAIPEALIIEGAPELGPLLEPVATDRLLLNKSLSVLRRYSLVKRNPVTSELSIHRLVAAVQRDSMDEGQRRLWLERALKATNRVFPEVDLITWERCRPYLAHALTCISSAERYGLSSLDVARLCNQVGVYLMVDAKYKEAEKLLQQASNIYKMALTREASNIVHRFLVHSLHNLGELYLVQANYKLSRCVLEEALEITERFLGQKEPDVAMTLYKIALVFYHEGKYKDAEIRCRKALDIRCEILDTTHPDYARGLDLLAKIYMAQGKYDLAESCYVQALDILEENLLHHQDILSIQTLKAQILNNKARLYRLKGEYSKAEPAYLNALMIQEELLGRWHPAVAQTLNNLARLYRAQGEYVKAEPLYQRALNIRESVFGKDHPAVAESYYCLSKLCYSQGKYAQARRLCQQALDIQKRKLEHDHPDIVRTLSILARIQSSQHEYVEAEVLYKRILHIREKFWGSEHPEIALFLNLLAEVYQAQKRYDESEPLIKRALAIRKQFLGSKHPYVAYTLSDLAEIYFHQGDYVEAEHLYKEALVIRERSLGPSHPQTAFSYYKLAKFYFVLKKYDNSKELYRKALMIFEQSVGLEDPNAENVQKNYIELLRLTDQEELALQIERQAKKED